jgi:response regulator of citrate/malate metabolism
MNGEVENSIVKAIQNSEFTIEEISKLVGINRITASKYLLVMEAKGTLIHRNIGKAKLFRKSTVVKINED